MFKCIQLEFEQGYEESRRDFQKGGIGLLHILEFFLRSSTLRNEGHSKDIIYFMFRLCIAAM